MEPIDYLLLMLRKHRAIKKAAEAGNYKLFSELYDDLEWAADMAAQKWKGGRNG